VNVTIATLITLCTVPVFAALLSAPLLREHVHRNIYFAMVVAIAGVVLLVGFQPVNDFGANAWLGIALALLTALGSALFQICGRMVSNRYHPIQTLTIFFFVAALAILPLALLNGLALTYPPAGWLFLLYLGVGISVIGYGFLILGLRTTPATIATIIALLEPLTGALLAWLLLGERLGATGIAGAALLLAAMVLVMRSNRETAEPAEV
jgi:DME family drug/metabolite transporter